MNSSLRNRLREVANRVAPHISLFGHDIFADLKKRKAGFKPEVILDVGANIGDNVREYCRRFPGVKVYAFEPGAENFAVLEKNTAGLPVELFRIGLGSENRKAAFTHDPSRPKMSHIVDAGEGDQSIQVARLDDFVAEHAINRISYLKIDTEGFDLEVLKGAEATLARGAIDFIEVEAGVGIDNDYHVSLIEFMQFLEPHGYSVFGFYEQMMDWRTKKPYLRRCNTVFMHRQLA